ncbi:hypothetical protein Q7P37_002365 [Cladosporium fusiforme]
MVKFILIVTALGALAQGHVLPEKRALTPAICTTVNRLVTAAKQQAGATAFCSSYLSIPVVTVPKTVSTETKTATNFAVVYTTEVSTTISVVSTDTVTAACPTKTITQRDLVKRATVTKPSCLAAYTAKAILSSACSCLSVQKSTFTKLVTATETITPTQVSTYTTVEVVPSTATQTVQPTNCNSEKIANGGFEEVPDEDLNSRGGIRGGWAQQGGAEIRANSATATVNTPYGNKYGYLVANLPATPSSAIFRRVSDVTIGSTYELQWSYNLEAATALTQECEFAVLLYNAKVATVAFDGNVLWTSDSRVFTVTSDGAPFVRFQLECPASNQGQRAVARIDEISVQPVVVAT